MRKTYVLALAAVFSVQGCGGGGGGTATLAELRGTVVRLDGQSADRSGVEVAVPETGDSTITWMDGTFVFVGVPEGTVTLEFRSPFGWPARLGGDDGALLGRDAEGDPRLRGIAGGDIVEVLVSIEGERIVEMCVSTGDEGEATASLEPAADSPLEGVGGEVEVETGKHGDELELKVTGLPEGTEVDVLLEDPEDGFTSIGTAAADADGRAKLELEGDLPLGAEGIADLGGIAIEVRLLETGELLLTGTVPSLDPADGGDDGEEEDEEEEDEDRPKGDAKADLELATDSPLTDISGRIEIEASKHGDTFEVVLCGLEAGTVIDLLLDDPADMNGAMSIGTATADEDGRAKLRLKTKAGDELPFGAESVADLAGFGVEVRLDETDELLLTGTVPSLEDDDCDDDDDEEEEEEEEEG
jgi:hypothetical protein